MVYFIFFVNKIHMKALVIAMLTAASTVMFTISASAHENVEQSDQIAVLGVGEVEVEPDQAILTVRVFAQKPTILEAKQLADKRYKQSLKVLSKAKIDSSNIKATQILAQPQYEWRNSKQVFKGNLVSRTLQITINDLDQVSALMQNLIENEISTIDNLRTGFRDREALMQLALAAAADNAKQKAEFLAKRLNRTLGSAFKITEHNQNSPKRPMMMHAQQGRSAMNADAPQEMFGTEKVSARVNVSFYLL